MIARRPPVGRLILAALVLVFATTILLICFIGLGWIPPEPTAGIIAVIGGTITWIAAICRWVRRPHG